MLINFRGHIPTVAEGVFIAENSVVVGRCTIQEDCSVWFNAVIRADVNEINIGRGSNIQDGCVLHCDHDHPTNIGYSVTVGHNAIIHGCTIGNNCIIGMGSTVLDGAIIGDNSIVGANSLVTQGKRFPSNSLIMGSPAKVVRELTQEEVLGIADSVDGYVKLSKDYSK